MSDLHDRSRKDPTLVPAFVEEVLRFDPPVYAESVNRDERLFEDPDTFNIDRRRHSGLSFTYGIHSCLDAALARAAARMALEALRAPHARGVYCDAPSV